MCKEIVLTGSPYDMGFRHGSLCRDEVLNSMNSYRLRFIKNCNYSWQQAKRIARECLPYMTGEYGRYIEEMQGVADGAGVSFDDILALNCRTEILYSPHSASEDEPDECTAFSAVSPATKDGKVIAGQTWDYLISQRRSSVIARIPAADGMPDRLYFLEGGMIGGKGVNGAGMALTLNALRTRSEGKGVPLHIRMRRVLECTYFSDAYAKACTAPIPCAANLLLTHKDGISLSIELDPAGCDVILPRDGIIVHTNHYCGPRMIPIHDCPASASTFVRYQALDRLLRGCAELDIGDAEEFFRDHHGYPTSICAHPHPDTPADEIDNANATNYAFVAELTSGTVRFAEGNPCETRYRTIPIKAV